MTDKIIFSFLFSISFEFSIPSLRSPLLLSHPFHLSVISSFHIPLPSSSSFTLKQSPQSRSSSLSSFFLLPSFLLRVFPILFTCPSHHHSISPSFLPLLYRNKRILLIPFLYPSAFLPHSFFFVHPTIVTLSIA